MQTIELAGDLALETASHLQGWQGSGTLLQREGPDLYLRASCGPLLPGSLPLGNDPQKAADILRWFTDWEVRPAGPEDLQEMCDLKAQSIQETFLFLDQSERAREISAVADPKRMAQELEEASFWVARRDGKLWALGGLRQLSKKEGLVSSGYSLGNRAGSALLALCILESEKRGYKKLWAHVYGYNDQSPRQLRYQGFRLSGRLWTSSTNPPHRIRAWRLAL